MGAAQGAERERVGVTVCSLLRLWKSQNTHLAFGGTQEDEMGNTNFEIRKSEEQAGMTEKSAPPFQKAKPKG